MIKFINRRGHCLALKRNPYLVGSPAVRAPAFHTSKWRCKHRKLNALCFHEINSVTTEQIRFRREFGLSANSTSSVCVSFSQERKNYSKSASD
jgi:hypothetical protein